MINSRDPYELHPIVRGMLEQHVKECEERGVDLLVTSTWRDGESQNALYNQGRTKPGKIVTNAKPGQSWHNWRAAYDIVPLVNGKPVWGTAGDDLLLWKQVGLCGLLCGLEWGGLWKSPDYPHFQFTAGLTIADMQAGKKLPEALP